MHKVLFITDTPPKAKTGGGLNGNMHKLVINEIAKQNVINLYITMNSDGISKEDIYISASSYREKVLAALKGYPAYLNSRAIKMIHSIIRKESISVVYIDNSVSGKLIYDLKNTYQDIKYIAFFHDIEIIKMADEAHQTGFLRRLMLPVYFANEKLTAEYADATIVLNERDRLLYKQNYGGDPTGIVPVGVPSVKGKEDKGQHKAYQKLQIIFVGAEYAPNLMGLRWFLEKVIPLMDFEFELYIIGFHMEKYRSEFENKSACIKVVGTVDCLDEWYWNADVVAGPIFEGGGMKVKTAEAFMYGKHFVGCSECLEGYWEDIPEKFKFSKIYRCNKAEKFAYALKQLSERTFDKIDFSIRNWAEGLYSYESIIGKYKAVFDTVDRLL